MRWISALVDWPSFTPAVLCSQCPSRFSRPSTKSPGAGSLASAVPWSTPTSLQPSQPPRLPLTTGTLVVGTCSLRQCAPTACGSLPARPGSPLRLTRYCTRELERSPRFLGSPCAHALLHHTPAEPRARPHGPSVLPSVSLTTSASTTPISGLLTRPTHPLALRTCSVAARRVRQARSFI